jgi:hypothetical protein
MAIRRVPLLSLIGLALLLTACTERYNPAAGPISPAVSPPPPGAPVAVAAVTVGTRPDCLVTGAAVPLGRNWFVTAAHVVDGSQPMLRGCSTGAVLPSLGLAGRQAPAAVASLGRGDISPGIGLRYFDGRDLALLRQQGPALPTAAATPCLGEAVPGQRVTVVTAESARPSVVTGTMREDHAEFGGYAEVALHLAPGDSGGGVFDAQTGCLLGVVSHREIAGGREHTRIVSAPVLRQFIAEGRGHIELAAAPN